MQDEDIVVIWEAPKIVPPEFRLYYDESGKVLCYTCEKLEGNYIVIDAATFAQGRPDVRVINGKISQVSPNAIISKLMPDEIGISCSDQDISVIVNINDENKMFWKLNTYEIE